MMHRTLLCLALLACAAPSADAGCKGLFKFKPFAKRKAERGEVAAAVVVTESTSASATDQRGVLRWAGRVVTSPVRTVAGAASSCPNGNCKRK